MTEFLEKNPAKVLVGVEFCTGSMLIPMNKTGSPFPF